MALVCATLERGMDRRLERLLRDRIEKLPAGLQPRFSKHERVILIDNPKAGGGTFGAYGEWAEQIYSFLGYPVERWLTERPGHAEELAPRAAAAGAGLVVSCSGDGGVRDTVAGLMTLPSEQRPRLSVIPKGTANVLAKTVGLQAGPVPDLLHACLRQLYGARERTLDVGFVDGTAFACFVGFGFDAAVIENVPAKDKRFLKEWAYLKSGLQTLFGWSWNERRFEPYRPPLMRVTGTDAAGKAVDVRGYFVAVGNVGDYGSNLFPFMHGAQIDDGKLDVVVVLTRELGELLRIGQQVVRRTHLKNPHVVSFQSGEPFVVESLEAPVPMHADCELQERQESVRVRVVPAALRVLA